MREGCKKCCKKCVFCQTSLDPQHTKEAEDEQAVGLLQEDNHDIQDDDDEDIHDDDDELLANGLRDSLPHLSSCQSELTNCSLSTAECGHILIPLYCGHILIPLYCGHTVWSHLDPAAPTWPDGN